ncbi:MAG TPA: ferrochelatase [Candidatus Polarisedimenticolia bacterium]|nr:ferrochelatase [Candidatus Polarisedimenticolia bacterium]
MSPPIDAVLLAGFGGPDSSGEIMPFLRRVTAGRGVPDQRLAEVARHYEAVGGRSPYNEQTRMLASALEQWLRAAGRSLPVEIGMRSSEPFLAGTMKRMVSAGRRRAAAVILAAHRSEAGWDRYVADIARAAAEAGGPEIARLDPWHDDPGFLEACAQRIEQSTGRRRGAWPDHIPLIFTAHSIPMASADRSPYVADVTASCRGVASLLRPARWRLAWQSRSGDPRSAWLEPDIAEVLKEEAARGTREAVLQAIGFLSDHVEVLYDLDVEAAGVAAGLGLVLRRAPCVDAHPEFVGMLGRRILALCGP